MPKFPELFGKSLIFDLIYYFFNFLLFILIYVGGCSSGTDSFFMHNNVQYFLQSLQPQFNRVVVSVYILRMFIFKTPYVLSTGIFDDTISTAKDHLIVFRI